MNIIKSPFYLCAALVLTVFVIIPGHAQQHPIFTQYMFNGLVLNPAYSGSHKSTTFTATMRRQWSGIKDAPQTEVFSVHSPIRVTRSSAGLVATHDHLGVTDQYMIYGTYAYRIPVSAYGRLAVGAQAGFTYYRANFTDLEIITASGLSDPVFANNDSRWLPNLGIGIYYNDKKTYIGLSLPTLIDNRWNNQDPQLTATQQRHYFLTAGHVFDLNPDLKLKPNILLKWVENGPFQYDINANLLIQRVLWVGVSYRMQDSVDGLLEWNINDQLSLGYSYGYPTSKLATLQSGTHEIVINFRMKRNKNILLSPRYF